MAHLMKALQWTAAQALDFIKEKRPQIRPNQGFLQQLDEWATRMNEDPGSLLTKPKRLFDEELQEIFIMEDEDEDEVQGGQGE